MRDIRFPVTAIIRKASVPGKVGFEIEPDIGALIDEYIRQVKWSGVVAFVTLAKPKRLRSTGEKSANHHLNGHIGQISEETGNDFEDVKLYVKRKAMRRGLPAKTNNKGEIVYSLIDKEPLPMSEADMDVEQCGWCIDEAHQLADELGIRLREGLM